MDLEKSADPAESPRASLPALGEGDLPRQKRRKISAACEPCRARKVRCDGSRPICGPCRHRSHDSQCCVYTKDAPNSGMERTVSTRSLIDRIQSLERVIASSSQHAAIEIEEGSPSPSLASRDRVDSQFQHLDKSTTPHHVPANDLRNSTSYGRGIESTGDRVLEARDDSTSGKNQSKTTSTNAEQGHSPVNAMGSTAYIDSRVTSQLNAVNEYYGGSSSARFMQQVSEAIPATGRISSNDVGSSSAPSLTQRATLSTSSSYRTLHPSGDFSLPPRDLADTLLANYWTKAYSLYPFVNKPSFIRAYEDLWKPSAELHRDVKEYDLGLGTPGVSDSRTIVFHCALNAIFALSCQLSGAEILQQDREFLSQTFFLRSKSLLHVDILDHGSVALVQTLLIVAQYLQSTSFPSRCWISLGLACRIGQGLGLHVEDGGLRRDPREVELRRRIWYGCTVMDVVASTTLGRPMMIPCHVIIPLPSPTLEDESLVNMDEPISHFTFYVETIKLYLILGKIISTVYNPWSAQGVSSDSERKENSSQIDSTYFEAIMSLDEELSDFEDGVVSYLHWERGSDRRDSLPERSQRIIRRQTNVLRARYLHIRVLLHRRTFLRFCRKVGAAQQSRGLPVDKSYSVPGEHQFRKEGNLRSKMDLQSSAACTSAAIDLVNLLHDSATKELDGAWWYTTFYVSTAAMVLALAESCLKTHQDFDRREIHVAWTLCCETLRILITRGHPVEHALNGITNIYQKLVPDQSPKGLSVKPPSQLSGLTSADTIEVQHAAADPKGASSFAPAATQEQFGLNSGGSGGPEEMDPPVMQPLIDFMTQDTNLMRFGMMDESWWPFQAGDSTINFGM